MKKNLLIPLIFALLGYLFSCFLAKIGGELPLEMSIENYKFVFLNSLALSYSLMGLILGIFLSFLIKIIKTKLK